MERRTESRPDGLVSRERVSAILEAGLAYPFMTVVAAPGYGKSIAVLDYARQSRRKLIRHHLLPIDNDPDCFWDRAGEAARAELPQLAEVMDKMKFPETLGEFHVFLKNFSRILYQDHDEVLLIYDSGENITDERLLLFLDSLIKAELENLSLIFISNVRPQFGHLVGEGRHWQMGPAELQFTEAETMQLFKKLGRPIGQEESAKLTAMTGGWPLALNLMASQPGRQAHHSFGETPHLHVLAELFHQNYFLNYDQDFQDLLVRLSFFDGVPLGLIRALGSGRTAETVERLTRNIFISYDYSQEYFYFQKMYHDFLRQKQALLSPGEAEEVYSVAGDWFYHKGSYLEALLCYWEIRDYDRYLKALAQMPQKRRNKRSVNTVLDQLNQFPPDYGLDHENVDLYRGLLYLSDLKINQARKILLALTERLENRLNSPEQRLILGDAYTLLLECALAQSDLDAKEYALKAQTFAPEGARIRSGEALVVGNIEVFFLPDDAPGRLAGMLEFIESLAGPLKMLYRKSGRGFTDLFAAEGAYYAQRFGEAREYSAKAAFQASEAGQHDIVLNAFILQLRLALFQGWYEKAEEAVNKIVDYASQADSPELYPLRDYALALFHLWLDDGPRAPAWLSLGQRSPAEIPLDIGRDRIMAALCRLAEGHFEAAYVTLLELDAVLEEHRQWGLQVGGHILKAACLHQMGNRPKALRAFWAAYDMTWRNEVIVCFAEFGKLVEPLIDAARRQDEFYFDPQWLNMVQTAAAACARRRSAMQKFYKSDVLVRKWHPDELTPRELEVMRFLSNGLTRGEMGSLLGISLHGVKKHITNIYSKLGAVNRVEAVHIAKVNGLLEGQE